MKRQMKSEHVLQRYLTPTALRIRKSPIRLIMQRAAKIEGKVTKFGGGQPQSKLFPIDDNAQIRVPISTFDGGTKIVSAKIDTTMALNYNGRTYNKGLPGLSKWIFNHMDKFHPRSKSSFDCCITSGSTDALNKCIVMLSEPGDVILACEFTYTGILVNPKAQGRVIESVAMDHNGMLPKSLDETCRKIRASGKRVRLVYLIPTGQNPTGTTMPLIRRKEILDICSKLDLVVIEDDPYFFLNLPKPSSKPVQSLFSLDTDGRVVRLDSFSKVVAPGFRLGWISAAKCFMDKFDALSQVTTWSASGISQSVLLAILEEWGDEGFEKQISKLCKSYTRRRDALLKAMDEHLSDLATWTIPKAGMFIWIRIHGSKDTREDCIDTMLNARVVMVPGGSFQPDTTKKCPYFRVTFATALEEDFGPAIKRFASELKKAKFNYMSK